MNDSAHARSPDDQIVHLEEMLQGEAKKAARRMELLKRLEWHVSDHPANAYCLICGRYKREGHASYCDLAKELQEVTA